MDWAGFSLVTISGNQYEAKQRLLIHRNRKEFDFIPGLPQGLMGNQGEWTSFKPVGMKWHCHFQTSRWDVS